jgi:two-component system response regulator FimZ (fimbrial Z protein)
VGKITINLKTLNKKMETKFKKLSKRETQVLQMLLEEKKNHEISKELNLDEKTISTYKLRILQKTNSKTVVGLYKFNLKHNIVVVD